MSTDSEAKLDRAEQLLHEQVEAQRNMLDRTLDGNSQRGDIVVLQKAQLFVVKAIGSALVMAAIAGIGLLINDHFGLVQVRDQIVSLKTSIETTNIASENRLARWTDWRELIERHLATEERDISALTLRVGVNEKDILKTQAIRGSK